MSYNIYFGRIPFGRSDTLLNIYDIDKEHLDSYFKVTVSDVSYPTTYNFGIFNSYKADSLGLEFVFSLDSSSYNQHFFDDYNIVYLERGFLYTPFDILSIEYTGSNHFRCKCLLSNYCLAKQPYTDIDVNHLKLHNGYIKYGYKYDSLVNSEGKVNYSLYRDTDLYRPPYLSNISSILYKRFQIYQSFGGYQKSKVIGDAIAGWGCLFLEPRTYEFKSGFKIDIQPCKIAGDILPYGMLIYPIRYNTEYIINLNDKIWNSKVIDFLKEEFGTEYFYGNRIYPYINSNVNVNVYTDTKVINFSVGGLDSIPITFESDGVSYNTLMVINQKNNNIGGIIDSNEIFNSGFFPNPFKYNQVVQDSDMHSMYHNPYVANFCNEFSITDYSSTSYNYRLSDLGNVEDYRFTIYQPMLIETSEYLITPEGGENSLFLNKELYKTFLGFLGSNNYSITYRSDKLADYLAQNSNVFEIKKLMGGTQIAKNVVSGMGKTLSQIGGGIASGKVTGVAGGMVSGLSTYATTAINAGIDIYALNKEIDLEQEQLQNAPDNLKIASSNYYLHLYNSNIRPYMEWRITSNYVRRNIYQDFIQKGIYLNKYVTPLEFKDYYTITDKKYDKKNYKYIEGDFDLYLNELGGTYRNNAIIYSNIQAINARFNRGCRIYKGDYQTWDVNSENKLMNQVSEEDFNNGE